MNIEEASKTLKPVMPKEVLLCWTQI